MKELPIYFEICIPKFTHLATNVLLRDGRGQIQPLSTNSNPKYAHQYHDAC